MTRRLFTFTRFPSFIIFHFPSAGIASPLTEQENGGKKKLSSFSSANFEVFNLFN